MPALAALRARGFRLHASAVSLEELWAQAVRDGKLGLLSSRIPKIAPLIDEVEPVKTAGVDLVRRLGGSVDPTFVTGETVSPAHFRALWQRLSSRTLTDEWLTRGGEMVIDSAHERATGWLATVDIAASHPEWDGVEASELEIARQVTQQFFETFGRTISIPGGMHERFEAYYRAAGLHAARARRRKLGKLPKPDENDAEDLQLLWHLAEPAFLATNDLNLIEHVDASGSFQAPWVRTIGELLTMDLPRGLPWGRSARRALDNHRRMDRVALNRLEAKVRRDIGSSTAPSPPAAK